MAKQDDRLQGELYTDLLMDMYARISEFQSKAPYNVCFNELQKKSDEIAIAYHKSRFYPDQEHFAQWEKLLEEAKQLLRKAGYFHSDQESQ